ncbi:MAG: WD40 repeat domain-containing protein [Bacteroidetes bacterium]|nr:WD40 repeat domain-containing protein [Bacteroidota bacterium]
MEIEVIKKGELTGHNGSIYALSAGFLPNTFLSGSSDRFVAEWNMELMQQTKLAIQLEQPVYSICHVKDPNVAEGLLLIGNGKGGIHIINLQEKKEVKLLQIHAAPVFDLKYSEINNCVYSASSDGNIARIDLKNFNTSLKNICNQKVRQIALNKEENTLAIAAGDCSVRILDAISMEELHQFGAHAQSANSVAFHPSGDYLISGGKDAHFNIWNIKDKYKLVKSVPAHNYAVYGIAFNPQGTLMATASRDKTIKIWDAENFKMLKRIDRKQLSGHIHSVNRIIWHENGLLISGGDDKKIMVWEVNG